MLLTKMLTLRLENVLLCVFGLQTNAGVECQCLSSLKISDLNTKSSTCIYVIGKHRYLTITMPIFFRLNVVRQKRQMTASSLRGQ